MLFNLVNEFAKKTGDYASLSAVDIRLIALTYELECCHVGKAHIKNEPDKNVSIVVIRDYALLPHLCYMPV